MVERGLILAVDDEVQLLNLVAEYLNRLGYGVRSCSNSEDALNEFRKAPETFKAVLIDCKLPGLSGQDLKTELRKLSPRVPMILLSGYSAKTVTLAEDASGRTRFLQKPFTPGELAAVLESLLAG